MPPKRKRPASSAQNDAAIESDAQIGNDSPAQEDAENTDDNTTMDPPTKRTRASSSAKSIANGTPKGKKPQVTVTTGGRVSMPHNGADEGQGEHGEAGKMRMQAPPQAGLVDPAGGYKTNKPPVGRPTRIYADGVFDLFHLGHMRVLQQAKTAFPDTYLIVGVTGDRETHKRKGLTVMSAAERAESVRHCRWVDEVIEDCPWIINIPFLEKHNIDFVAHDDEPYGASDGGDDIYKPLKEKGMFLVTQRTEGVSTTGIITKIVRDYEQYISRQLKRGTSRQELNVSWLKKNQLDIKRHVTELRQNIQQNWTTTGQELSKELRQFWQPSRPNSPAPHRTPSIRNGMSSGRDSPALLSPDMSMRASTPGGKGRNLDFAAGYAMGLIGGVKGWMEGSNRRNLSDSRAQSPNESSDERSPIDDEAEGSRGRKGKRDSTDGEDEEMRA